MFSGNTISGNLKRVFQVYLLRKIYLLSLCCTHYVIAPSYFIATRGWCAVRTLRKT